MFERYNIVSQADIVDAMNKLEYAQNESAVPEVGHDSTSGAVEGKKGEVQLSGTYNKI